MFTPGELERMPKALEKLYSELEWRIMQDIIRRLKINGEITRSADWQLYRYYELGESKKAIKQAVKDALDLSDHEINRLYSDAIASGYARDKALYMAAGKEFVPYAENFVLQQMVSAIKEQTLGELKNITQSLGFAKNVNGKLQFTELAGFYQKTLDAAMLDITSGAFDYNTVLRRTIETMTNSGLRTVDYASGWSNRVEVAARRALMTGITQIAGKINEQNAEEFGTEYFEISWHADARPTHQVWQGRVYTKEELKTVCGLGTGDGLAGWNCRHSYFPFIPGVSVRAYTDEELDRLNAKENLPKEWNGKQYTSYEASQKQRRMEATMRAQRQKIKLLKEGGASKEELMAAKSRYRKTMNDYVEFSEAMELPQQRERLYTGKKSNAAEVPRHEAPELIKKVDFSDKKAVQSVLEEYEREIAGDTVENAIVITRNGKVVRCRGTLNGVYPDADLGDELKGAVVTHNHPAGSGNEYSFSKLDIQLFLDNELAVLRGIDEKYFYELTRNPEEIDEPLSLFELMELNGEHGRHEKVIDIARRMKIGYRRWRRV